MTKLIRRTHPVAPPRPAPTTEVAPLSATIPAEGPSVLPTQIVARCVLNGIAALVSENPRYEAKEPTHNVIWRQLRLRIAEDLHALAARCDDASFVEQFCRSAEPDLDALGVAFPTTEPRPPQPGIDVG